MKIGDTIYDLKCLLRKAWLVVKHRPFFTCPACKGEGGAMSGYYEPEWSECYCCFDHWEALDDHGMKWPVGRMPPLRWLRAKISGDMGYDERTPIIDALRCRMGWHRFVRNEYMQGRVCARCYECEDD